MLAIKQNRMLPGKQASRRQPGARQQSLHLQRILVPLDFSGKSRQALEAAVPLASQYGAKISLIHVVEPVYAGPPYPGDIALTPWASPPDKSVERLLAARARELVPEHLRGQVVVRCGRAFVEIVDVADDLKADLIVIASHGRTGFKRMVMGSTAERVVRHAHCPVLIIRHQ